MGAIDCEGSRSATIGHSMSFGASQKHLLIADHCHDSGATQQEVLLTGKCDVLYIGLELKFRQDVNRHGCQLIFRVHLR